MESCVHVDPSVYARVAGGLKSEREGVDKAMGGGMAGPPDGPGKYSVYSRTRIPTEYPKIPEPYTTLSETFSY